MSVVSIVKLRKGDVPAAVRKAVSLSGGFESVAWESAKVLVKPNTVLPAKTGTGIVTDASVVEAVTKLLLERNPKKIIIGEGSSVGYDFRETCNSMHCMEIAGVTDVAKKLGVEVVDLNRDEHVEVSAFIYLNKAGFHEKLPHLALIMGTPEEIPPLKEKPVVLGRCAKEYRDQGIFVPGCPPHGLKITDAVCQALEIDQNVVHRAVAELHDFSAD